MSLTQQYLLDTYRALHHGESAPPAPGTHHVRVVRELHRWLHRQTRARR